MQSSFPQLPIYIYIVCPFITSHPHKLSYAVCTRNRNYQFISRVVRSFVTCMLPGSSYNKYKHYILLYAVIICRYLCFIRVTVLIILTKFKASFYHIMLPIMTEIHKCINNKLQFETRNASHNCKRVCKECWELLYLYPILWSRDKRTKTLRPEDSRGELISLSGTDCIVSTTREMN